MDKAKEYRAQAAAALKLADRSDDDDFKATILRVAQGWLKLAERAEKRNPLPKEVMRREDQPNRRTH
jgi:hypothetical protein